MELKLNGNMPYGVKDNNCYLEMGKAVLCYILIVYLKLLCYHLSHIFQSHMLQLI